VSLSLENALGLRKEAVIPIGLAISSFIALALTSEVYIAVGLLILAALVVSASPIARIGLLILLLPFAHAGIGIESLPGFGIYDAYNAFFLLLFILKIAVHDAFRFNRIPVLGLTGVMLVAYVPSLLNSVDVGLSLQWMVQFSVGALTAAGVCYYLMRESDEKIIFRLLVLFVIEAAVISGFGIYDTYTSRSFIKVVTGRVYFGPFQDVNYYASYLLMALALAGGFMVMGRGLILTATSTLAFVVLLASVISTVSRSGLATLAVMSLVFMIYLSLTFKGAKRLFGVSFLVFSGIVVLILVFTDVGGRLVDLFTLSRRLETLVAGKDPSVDQRLKIFEVGTRVVRSQPIIGIGFGTFEKSYDNFKGAEISTGSSRGAHNTGLRILAETGIVGFLPSVAFVVAILAYLVRAYRKVPHRRERILVASVFFSITSFLLMSLSLDMIFEPHYWVILGVGLALASRYVEAEKGTFTLVGGIRERRSSGDLSLPEVAQ
jgi:hypothetical protein